MDLSIFIGIGAVLLLVAANGFFVAAEFALVSVRRTRIDQLAEEGVGKALVVQASLVNLDRYIAGTQVGITLASLALGWVGEPAVASVLSPVLNSLSPGISVASVHSISVVIAFILITFLHVILGELVPKSVALQLPEQTCLALARPLMITVAIFRPLIWSLNGLGNALLKLIGLRAAAGHESVHSAQELESLVKESHEAGILDDLEKRILQRAFRFSETTVGEVMVPRARMQALDINQDIETFINSASESKHSRLPVYEKSLDQVIGVIYLYELFRMSRRGGQKIKEYVRPALYVPDTLHLDDMIKKFRSQNVQIAIVIDEHGGTAGLITLEDVVEAVFGKIQDANEEPLAEVAKDGNGTMFVRGDARLIDLNETLGLELDESDADTIAGYIMHSLGRVPRVGDEIKVGEKKFLVQGMNRFRVTKVAIIDSPTNR